MSEQSIMDEILQEPIPGEEGISPAHSQPPMALPNLPERASFAGAMAGASLPPGSLLPPTRGIQTALGAGGMHFVGKTIQDLANDVPQNLSQIGDNLIEAGKQGLLAGTGEMLFPGMGVLATATGVKAGAGKVVGAIAHKIGEYILPQKGQVVQTTEKLLTKAGGPGLTPGQMVEGSGTDHHAIQIGENIAYASWTGGPIRSAYEANQRDLGNVVDAFVGRMEKLSPKDAEATFKDVITGRTMDYMMRPAKAAFDGLRSRAPGQVIDLIPQLKLLRDPNSKVGNLVIDGLRKIRETVPGDAKDIDNLVAVLDTPAKGTQTQAIKNLNLNQALYMKAELNRIANRKSYSGTPEGDLMLSSAGRINRQVDEQIKMGLEKQQTLSSDTTLVKDYEKANKFYAAAAEKFKGPLVTKVLDTIEKKPGSLARVLLPDSIPSEQEHLNIIKAVKSAYGPRWNIEAIPLLTATLGNRAYNLETQSYSGPLLAKELNKYGSTLLDSAIGPKMGEKLMDFARALDQVKERPKGTGSVAIQLMTAGALGATGGYLISGDIEKAAGGGVATVLLAPWMIGHLLANPQWLSAMKTGLLEFNKTGKPPGMLTTTLRQAAIASQGGTTAQKLSVEPDKSKVMSETALPQRPLAAETTPQ